MPSTATTSKFSMRRARPQRMIAGNAASTTALCSAVQPKNAGRFLETACLSRAAIGVHA